MSRIVKRIGSELLPSRSVPILGLPNLANRYIYIFTFYFKQILNLNIF
jgi:hypothetical protein